MTQQILPRTDVNFSRTGLQALAGGECGPLSPLARVEATDAPPDAAGLRSALQGLTGDWQHAAAALWDPQRTLTFLIGDSDTNLVGQYLWPDREGRGPGFQATVDDEAVTLSGPLSLSTISGVIADTLSLTQVLEPEVLRLSLSLSQFWALTAIADTYADAWLRRRLNRQLDRPHGACYDDIVANWAVGLRTRNLGWAVSLFLALLLGYVPTDFQDRLNVVLQQMEEDDLLTRLPAEEGDTRGDLFIFGDALESLCAAVVNGAHMFGIVLQEQVAAQQTDLLVLGGWRTPAGLWIADFQDIDNDRVELQLVGPTHVTDMLNDVIAPTVWNEDGEPILEDWSAFTLSSAYSKDALLAKLAEAPRAPEAEQSAASAAPATPAATVSTAAAFCPQCGNEVRPGARFCRSCGAALT